MEDKDRRCWKKEKIFAFIFIVLGLGIIIAYLNTDVIRSLYNTFSSQIENSKSSNFWQLQASALILLYTPTSAKYNRWRKFTKFKNYKKSCGCDLDGFEITQNKNRFSDSDIVIFHGASLPDFDEMKSLSRMKKRRSLWIYFVRENPINAKFDKRYVKYFNFSITYRIKSDITYGYGSYSRKKKTVNILKARKNYFRGKSQMIAWAVSDCNKPRDSLARIFERYNMIKVTGNCRNNFRKQIKCNSYQCFDQLKKFKFYFAAENGFCDDYITEKYWQLAININSIPIVLGGGNYSDSRLAIPGSYINAFDFKSPKELVDHIRKVSYNETLYNSYFDWKERYKVYQEKKAGCSMLCKLYEKLVRGIFIKKHALKNIVNKNRECNKHQENYREWLQRT